MCYASLLNETLVSKKNDTLRFESGDDCKPDDAD
jgi:hypothetical protein